MNFTFPKHIGHNFASIFLDINLCGVGEFLVLVLYDLFGFFISGVYWFYHLFL
jgi:hypothetical protein